jgi:microtubule-associated protein-like 1/2
MALAISSTQGNLRLFQYPCTTARAEFVEEKSASTAVVAIRFLFEDMYVITAGGTDATLLRWKIV